MSRQHTLILFFFITALVFVVFSKIGKKVSVAADMTDQHFYDPHH